MLPFTREQLVDVFAHYNKTVWPAPAVAYLIFLVMVVAVARPRTPMGSRIVAEGLALMWIWTGVAYHGDACS